MKTEREKIIEEIESFLDRTGMKPTRLGVNALGDPSFVGDLHKGRRLYTETVEKVRAYMAAYKPPKNPKRAAAQAAA